MPQPSVWASWHIECHFESHLRVGWAHAVPWLQVFSLLPLYITSVGFTSKCFLQPQVSLTQLITSFLLGGLCTYMFNSSAASFFFFGGEGFETRSCRIAQTGLELAAILLPPPPLSVGITGVHQCTQSVLLDSC